MARKLVAQHAWLVALAGLIPFPFVDAWIQDALRRQLVRSLAKHHNAELEGQHVEILVRQNNNLLWGCFQGVVWWPIKKIIKKLVYILTVKDAADAAADTFIRGEMLRRALAAGVLPTRATEVRAVIDDVLATHTRSPLFGPKAKPTRAMPSTAEVWYVNVADTIARLGGATAALAAFDGRLATLAVPADMPSPAPDTPEPA